ncbi:hypothetical protein EPA93_28230 [Ktedonosporobacter rubrisoli]|uniref:Uncharacterized protein n=1 Tax=Ktedonosporobacter rubrisoli TaxID=2509675 RepID=A0A4P6JW15_KTERU|nr:hypothetical protein [Ktedonosporobacter rubrisoli]QBD79655.1 hypothetical protein EPA93_28230 [Ktedonosporobacter rubrisoli]
MEMNLGGISDIIRQKANQVLPSNIQQAVANNDVAQKLMQAQEKARNGQLTVGESASAYQSAQKLFTDTEGFWKNLLPKNPLG